MVEEKNQFYTLSLDLHIGDMAYECTTHMHARKCRHTHNHNGCQGPGESYLLPNIIDKTPVDLTTGKKIASFSCHLSRPQQSTQNLSSNLDS